MARVSLKPNDRYENPRSPKKENKRSISRGQPGYAPKNDQYSGLAPACQLKIVAAFRALPRYINHRDRYRPYIRRDAPWASNPGANTPEALSAHAVDGN